MPRRRRDARVTPGAARGPSERAGTLALLVTCEHGGNRIPAPYAPLFRDHGALLETHRGYDAGALAMARTLARVLAATLLVSTVSRLLVELNRSPGRQFRHSPIMRVAPPDVRAAVCGHYYMPYRDKVEAFVGGAIAAGRRVLHVSSHSFTPTLDGLVRNADVGLLFDPRRRSERELCHRWQAALKERAPHWIVRRNYPYRGVSDGLTTWLRRRFPDRRYSGIELEINQRHARDGHAIAARDRTAVALALCEALALT
jgi:predicted N-formylglutamate amidohydrolase